MASHNSQLTSYGFSCANQELLLRMLRRMRSKKTLLLSGIEYLIGTANLADPAIFLVSDHARLRLVPGVPGKCSAPCQRAGRAASVDLAVAAAVLLHGNYAVGTPRKVSESPFPIPDAAQFVAPAYPWQ